MVEDTLNDLRSMFNNAPDLKNTLRKYIEENSELKHQVEQYMHEKEAAVKDKLIQSVQHCNGVNLIRMCAPMTPDMVKNLAFQLRAEVDDVLFVAGTVDNNRPLLTVSMSDSLVAKGMKAGLLVKEAARLIQGGGGGQPHFAQAGGKNADGLSAAVDKIIELAQL
jgi:alanyl-tRNA synthetase